MDEFKRAYGTYESIGYRRGQADVMCSLGNAYREEPDSLDARIAYGGCLSIAIKIGSPFLQVIGYSSPTDHFGQGL